MDYRGLTIGDWLLDKEEGFARRVVQVTDDAFDGCGAGVILENGMDYEECEPIPLTAEILEKNGFTKSYSQNERILKKDGYDITIDFGEKIHWTNIEIPTEGSVMPLRYFEGYISLVHELQHALRLCGLNELADNFKV